MNSKKKVLLGTSILVVIVLVIGISYALWTFNISQTGVNTITSGCLKLEITNESDAISLSNAYPISDEEGLKLEPYTFTINNSCSASVDYNISLEMMEIENKLATSYVAISIDNELKKILNTLEETELTYNKGDYTPYEGRLLLRGSLKGNSSKTHSIRLWLDEATPAIDEAMNKTFISKVVLNATLKEIYAEAILNGADPVLKDNLIPVIIGNSGVVTKANIKEEWYSYEKKNWANAVILEDESVTYEDEEVIPEDNIESYFVWIPRYKYKIWTNDSYGSLTEVTESKVQEIDVIFENKDTIPSIDTSVGSYYTHPAFVSMNTNGLWVGKFETGYKDATSTSSAESNTEDSAKVVIKPNVYSWRNINVSNAFYTSYNYQRNLDSHMMKNTEWGAVAYLTNSQYGRCASGTCEEVRLNNNQSYITGYAAKNEPTTGYTEYNDYETTSLGLDGTKTYNYKNILSQVASTTGNYSGIYDMSGGAWDYMMGVILDSTNTNPLSGQNATYNSGFKGKYGESGSNTSGRELPETKYYDAYKYSTNESDFSRYIYGDATGELGPFASRRYNNQTRKISSWYDDEAWFVSSLYPWFTRGGFFGTGTGSGVIAFNHVAGQSNVFNGFRIVLAV